MSNIIEEKLDPNIKIALYSNFSNAYEAIQEIIDNSVSHRIIGKKMKIEIFFITKPKKLIIIDRGGSGMNLDYLNMFFNWGKSKSRSYFDIGLYNQGGKSAIGYLGNAFVLETSPTNKNKIYKVEDDNLADTSKLKKYRVNHFPTSNKDGYTSIQIDQLKINLTDNLKEKLKAMFLDTYRPLLEKGEIEFFIDGAKINIKVFPLDSEFHVENISFEITKDKRVSGWIGRLIPRSGVRGGMRCYYKGRLICDREFFGHPDPTYKGTLNFLFGEIYLNFVPVNTNKTDFRRDSQEWEIANEKMSNILLPHINDLLGREIKEPTEEDINKVKKVRDLFQIILRNIKTQNNAGFVFHGEDSGQKKPEFKGMEAKTLNDASIVKKQYQPRTPPPPDKIGKRQRLRSFMDWEVRNMDESIRSKIEEKTGGKVLVINNIFPGYIQTKASAFYLLETAALQTVPIENTELSPKQYLEEFDRFFGKICENINIAQEMLSKKRL